MQFVSNLAISMILILFGIWGIALNRENIRLKQHSICPYFDTRKNKKSE